MNSNKTQWVCKACNSISVLDGKSESWASQRDYQLPTVWTFCPKCEAKYKGQKVTIRLTAEENFLIQRFLRNAKDIYQEKLTLELIVENFISDFLGSMRSNGSDERMYAEQWFQRTYLAWPKENEI